MTGDPIISGPTTFDAITFSDVSDCLDVPENSVHTVYDILATLGCAPRFRMGPLIEPDVGDDPFFSETVDPEARTVSRQWSSYIRLDQNVISYCGSPLSGSFIANPFGSEIIAPGGANHPLTDRILVNMLFEA
jgi:hypothetical protein